MSIDKAQQAIARSQVYALLAAAFRYPDSETFQSMANGDFAATLEEALDACDRDLLAMFRQSVLPRLNVATSFEDFQSDYVSAFVTDMPTPSASLYEGSHVRGVERPALLLELKGFFKTFGLEMAGSENDLEDALVAELEFMQFLLAKLAQAEHTEQAAGSYQRARRDFLERHLTAWLPSLRAEMLEKIRLPFFLALVDLVVEFVARDHAQALMECPPAVTA